MAITVGVSSAIVPAEEIPQDPEGTGQVIYGFLNIFSAGAGVVGVIIFIVLGLFKILIGLAIIWLVFLIYYLVIRHKFKKQNMMPTTNQ